MKTAMLWIGPLVAAGIGWWASTSGLSDNSAWTAAVTTLCALWWLTEAIPIPATSLIPLAVLPMLGILTPAEVGQSYGHPLILLLMGGFMLSTAMERSGAHRRIALQMVRLFGAEREGGGRRLVFGFIAASALLSMWISNTATTLMLLPIVMAVIAQGAAPPLRIALLLGVAYGASVGGIGTPVGTPPNLVFMQVYSEFATTHPEQFGTEPTFLGWMRMALPVSLVMLPLMAFWLTRSLPRQGAIRLPEVGAWQQPEVRTLLLFALTALLWITRKEPFGGWSGEHALDLPGANDAGVAMLAVVAMFLLPNGKGEKLLDWPTAVKIPWGVLVLYGSGIAVAKAFTTSGLADTIGKNFEMLADLPPLLLVGSVCLIVTFLTEVTSNTATTTLLMPILAAAAVATQVDPRLLMVPAAISASFAFMLPVATAPNSIVFGSGEITTSTMAREGFALNLVGAVVVTLVCYVMLG